MENRKKRGGGCFVWFGWLAGRRLIFVLNPLPYPVFVNCFYTICFTYARGSAYFPKRRSRRFSGGCGGRKEKWLKRPPPE